MEARDDNAEKGVAFALTNSEGPNPVYDTAAGFLRAALAVFEKESERTWLLGPNWHVVHHLSVISVELFCKAMSVTGSHSHACDESGPDWIKYDPKKGHSAHLSDPPGVNEELLERHLTSRQYEMLANLKTEDITMGRYPFEGEGVFPLFEEGKALAQEWLELAQKLSTLRLEPLPDQFLPETILPSV